MSAGLLRKAAALMRERAETATPGPWVPDGAGELPYDIRARSGAGPTVATTVPLGMEERIANVSHIASWHPTAALAVADWLDQMARAAVGTSYGDLPFEDSAIAVASAYLGEPQ